MAKKLIIGNWKMNPETAARAEKLARAVSRRTAKTKSGAGVVICPPFPFLPVVRKAAGKGILIGAQDVSAEKSGAFTGEVSARQLKGLGVSYAIIGHSERRAMGESGRLINSKVRQALQHNIQPVLCVGFGAGRSAGAAEIKKIISQQLHSGLAGVRTGESRAAIAYEPVWAIGTGRAATPEHAAEICDFIRKRVSGFRVIYGGSVTERNAADFAKIGIEGALVGGASLDATEFLQIIKSFS